MQGGNRGLSLIQDSGTHHSSCGYCNDEGGLSSKAHGMHAYRMTVYDYQELLDQGWRRSGKYLYQPDNKVTCCRQYTIRLKVEDFRPSKSHKKLLRRWEQFLAGHIQHDKQDDEQDMADDISEREHPRGAKRSRNSRSSPGEQQDPKPAHCSNDTSHTALQPAACAQQPASNGCSIVDQLSQAQLLLHQAVQASQEAGQLPQQGLPDVSVIVPPAQKLAKLPAGTLFTSASAHALAAAVRRAQQQPQQLQLAEPNGAQQQMLSSAHDLADALVARFKAAAATQSNVLVRVTAVKGHINFSAVQQQLLLETRAGTQHSAGQEQALERHSQQQGREQVHQVQQQQKQQQTHAGHHEQQDRRQTPQQPQQHQQLGQQQQPHHLELRMVPSQFIQEEYELYCKYQLLQHHDDPEDLTPSRYRHFLVDTPLIPVMPQQPQQPQQQQQQQQPQPQQQQQHPGLAAGVACGIPSCGYGSFHQQYWLDGKLVAVGVVDVLPRCLSSKYFFWDPDYAWLSLGRYGALQEVQWVAAAHTAGAQQLEYYYLGYYIHNCHKMAYKAEYSPSELLCPEKQVWVKIDKTVLQALDSSPYVVLSNLPGVEMQPNLSVPRLVPASGAAGTVSEAAPELMGPSQQVRARLQQRQQLDSQLLFLLKQPVRWGVLRESGLLDEAQIRELEERLSAWQAVVAETAAYLMYATPSD